MIQMQLWFLVKLRRKNNTHEWMKLGTMSQSDKDSDTNEDEDGGGGCGGGDGSNDSGCDKDKDGSASDEHGDNGLFADNRHENSASFDQDQLELYERRFVEGYNLFFDSD